MFTYENTVAHSPMKATEKHFNLLRKTRVITKLSQKCCLHLTFFYKKKVEIGNFLRKSMSLDTRTEKHHCHDSAKLLGPWPTSPAPGHLQFRRPYT